MKVFAPHGTLRRYRQGGCDDLRGGSPGAGDRCDKCKLAMREFNLRERAGMSGKLKSVRGQPNSEPDPEEPTSIESRSRKSAGAVERSVTEQLSVYAKDEPVRVQMALSCARILDNMDRVALHATTVRQLEGIVDKLTAGKKKKSRGRLATVQNMTARR
jgi:hypothetical protein